MPRFFSDNIFEDKIVIDQEDSKHIKKVLRMKIGDELIVSSSHKMDYQCVISSLDGENVELEIISNKPNETEPTVEVVLYQALPKSDKMDLIMQKAVELGVTKIVPILTKRCVSRPDEKSMKKKIVRYQKIVKEAAKQCGRGIIPVVDEMKTFEQVIQNPDNLEKMIIFYEGGGGRINDIVSQNQKSVGIIIGSEGGFDLEEVEKAVDNGILKATLGKLILRCETAPLTAISILMNITKNI